MRLNRLGKRDVRFSRSGQGDRAFGYAQKRLWHLRRGAQRKLPPRSLGLTSVANEPGDRFEVGVEYDCAVLTGSLGDQRVERLLSRDELPVCPSIAVVNDDKWNATGSADPGEQRQIRLAAALDDRDRFSVDIVAERSEHEGQHELLGQTLDQDDCAGEEQLAARGVELGHHAEVVVGRHWLWLDSTRSSARKPLDKDNLIEPNDVKEGR